MRIKAFVLTGLLTASIFLSACSSEMIQVPTPVPSPVSTSTPTPMPPAAITSSISVVADPSLVEIKKKDPYAQISELVLKVHNPNKDLYNTLFDAIDKMEATVDVSEFPLSHFEKAATCDSLYEQAGFQFYYVNRIKLNSDGKTVTITYREKGDEVQKNKEVFYSKLSHLVYNVAPENYTPLQKLFSVYDYITVNADYTDNMQDETTHTPYSILMKGKGICGGFSNLGYYVLNLVGIKTDYISNEPHAWNMVELDGRKYHTDITWGAGHYGSGTNSLRTILMDDEERNIGLDNTGFGGYPIIEGYPRENPSKPLPAAYKDFNMFYYLYFEYALDIENNWVYYYDGEGIKRMTLDGKDTEIVSQMPATNLIAFNGALYYVNTNNQHLYKLQPGKEPELLDDSMKVELMHLKNGILHYQAVGAAEEKLLDLNPFVLTNVDIDKSMHQQSINIPLQQSFKFEIVFSADMNTEKLPKEAVGLVNQEGQTLPIHMHWKEDGRTLTVRSQVSLERESAVSLYVLPGIAASDGNLLKETYDITVYLD